MKGGNEAKKQLNKLLESSIDEEIDNPISTALVSLKLKQINVPEKQITAEIYDKLQSLDNRVGMVQNQIVRLASQGQSSIPQSSDTFKAVGDVILEDYWRAHKVVNNKDYQEFSKAQKKKDNDKIEYIGP
jgi:hypothetical protein